MGVFLSPDSVQGNAVGMNPYGYVGGNPETETDPSGRAYDWEQGGTGGGGDGADGAGAGVGGEDDSFTDASTSAIVSTGNGFEPAIQVDWSTPEEQVWEENGQTYVTTFDANGNEISINPVTAPDDLEGVDHGYVNAGETPQDRVEEPNGVRPEETEPQPPKPTENPSENKSPVKEQTPNSKGENVTIYRGTSNVAENWAFQETGYIMSDAAVNTYMDATRNGAGIPEALQAAQAAAEAAHANQLEVWGSSNDYAQAHSAFGSEISIFGPRSMISFTTDQSVAEYYAGREGTVYSTTVPASNLISQTLPGAGESEVLVLFMLLL